ncbi:glycosyltransferase [Acinetobacter pseudolwoffii]|uniref:glycosyltransferase n=1 Tax=Acinetobacter pseudolwoffii TaxID=2053287 RepID=UPI002646B622|nr:glycosyltransferase [Acinetobacter pseudolwoffii]
MKGFCIGILDSLAVGTPVVAYDIKYGPNEIIEDEYSGYLVEDGDIEALALAIEKTLLNNVMRDNAKESAKKYSLELNKQKWMNHLLELSNV